MLAKYSKMQYPRVFHNYDIAALNIPVQFRVKCKVLGHLNGYPDNFYMEPRCSYHGLFIELKREGTKLKNKNGEWASEHLEEQAEVLSKLESKGYKAVFAVGFDEAKQILDNYLKS